MGCIHRTFSSLSSKPQGFMLNGTNHILRGSALFGTAACCRWCPKNILFVYFAIEQSAECYLRGQQLPSLSVSEPNDERRRPPPTLVWKGPSKRHRWCLRLSFWWLPFSLDSWNKADKHTVIRASDWVSAKQSQATNCLWWENRGPSLEINICKHMGFKGKKNLQWFTKRK